MAITPRLNPTLFDKLVGGLEMDGLMAETASGTIDRESMRHYWAARIERFNEEALRATVRRELAWLLNTTNLGSVVDLTPFPQVETSVLNYGVPDLAGKLLTRRHVLQRARELRTAVRAFEPRLESATLSVDPVTDVERPNAVTYVIVGDVRSAVQALPVKFRTDIHTDTAAVTVRD